MDSTHPPLVRTRLSMMMCLEFFVWGGWYFAISGYANKTMQFSGTQVGWLVGTTALGAIIAPLFVGYVADRLFSTERVLCVMHIIGGACLILAAQQTSFAGMMTFLMINGLFFMPTLALVNSLAFTHIPDPDKFPRIAVLGTVGWIASNLIVALFLGGAEKNGFFYLSGGGGILLGLYCLTLPRTPPKGAESGGDVLGLSALKLLKEPSFLIFTICSFLIVIPAGVFFTACFVMLQERGYPAPLALTTLNQFAEIVFMFSMPLFIAKLGLKRVLAIGMLAWATRYVCFAVPSFPLAIVGLLLHGFCYSFVFVGAYMYVDKRAPADLKASAQSFIAFLMLGVGWLLGTTFLGGYLMDHFPAQVPNMPAAKVTKTDDGTEQKKPDQEAALPKWNDPDAATSAWRYLDLSATINSIITGEEAKPEPDLADKLDSNKDGILTLAEVEKIPDDGLRLGNMIYSRDEMIEVFNKIVKLKKSGEEAANGESGITRDDWLAAQSHDWTSLWLWPSGMAFAICAFFLLFFRDKPREDE